MWLCGGADNFPAPSILPAQHIFHGIIGLQFRVVELPAERDSCLRLGARAGIEGFHVAAERFRPRFSPVMPALGADMARLSPVSLQCENTSPYSCPAGVLAAVINALSSLWRFLEWISQWSKYAVLGPKTKSTSPLIKQSLK